MIVLAWQIGNMFSGLYLPMKLHKDVILFCLGFMMFDASCQGDGGFFTPIGFKSAIDSGNKNQPNHSFEKT